ncbi:MAG TPA: hypothetical protein VKK79_19855 [Candidatus Lokiarchaeia archaeon]|nr:hypothetical protein [Candidatus Lokiarchaeia archaeon]
MSDPREIQQWNTQRDRGQGEFGVQLPPEMKVSIFQAILNISKVYNRVELGKLSQKFGQTFETILSVVEDWLVSGIIYGQIIGRDLVFTKINKTEEEFRRSIYGPPVDQVAVNPYPQPEVEMSEAMPQAPIVFGDQGDETAEVQEKLIYSNIDLTFLAGFARLQVTIGNDSSSQITDVIIKFIFPKSLRLIRSKPSQYLKRQDGQAILTLPVVPAKTVSKVIFYLKPLFLEPFILKGAIQFTNAKQFVRIIAVDTLQFDIPVPSLEAGPDVTPEYVQELVQKSESRGIRSYGMPEGLEPLVGFNHIKQLMKSYNFQFVSESNSEDMLVAWFYAREFGGEREYAAVGQILNQKIEIFACGVEEKAIIGLLTDIGQKMRNRMVSSQILSSPEVFIELFCPHCGGTLEYLPKVGDTVACKWCETSFTFNP